MWKNTPRSCSHVVCISSPRAAPAPGRGDRGFTLLELLVAIGVIGVILAITLPALRNARATAERATLAAHQQQVFVALTQYTLDHQDRYPYWGERGTHHARLEHNGAVITSNHWEQHVYWGAFLEINGYNGRPSALAGAGPMRDDDRMTLRPGEVVEDRLVRFRTLGCYPLTGAIDSDADSLEAIVSEMLTARTSERQGRLIDRDEAGSMEKKKREGYF